jgi:hypothetical protein
MNKKNMAVSVVTLFLMSACATSPERQAKLAELQRTTPTCSGAEDCNAKWEAAQLWVVKNAGWKIQTQSTVLIETYNPANNSPAIAVRVTKEPLGGGKYQIFVKVWCANLFGCVPDSLDAALKFNREISIVTP